MSKEIKGPIAMYDITIPYEGYTLDSLRDLLRLYAKRWAFQAELGEKTGYKHWQVRLSLKKKQRCVQFVKSGMFKGHITPTSNPTTLAGDLFYVMKEPTRVEGPFTDKDAIRYIPRQYRNKMDDLRPFQKSIIEKVREHQNEKFDDRGINYVYCPHGNKGKSTLAHLMRLHIGGIVLPLVNDGEKLIQASCCMLRGTETRRAIPVCMDLPRSLKDQDKLGGMYVAIEQIKSGYVYDGRHHWKDWDFDSPSIWVFSNNKPKRSFVSRDRWKYWTISESMELHTYIVDIGADVEESESEYEGE